MSKHGKRAMSCCRADMRIGIEAGASLEVRLGGGPR